MLIFDGLERVLDTSEAQPGTGFIASAVVRELLAALMGPRSRARLLFTSQLDVVGIDPMGRLTSEILLPLSPPDGASLLRKLGAIDSDETLQNLSSAFHGHPLSLMAIPRILRQHGAGDLAKIKKEMSSDRRIRKVLFRYKDTLSVNALAVLRMISIFQRAVPLGTLQTTLGQLDTKLFSPSILEASIAECVDLVHIDAHGKLSTHPTVKEVFLGEWYRSERRKVLRVHKILAQHFYPLAAASHSNEHPSLADLEPAFDAYHHYTEINDLKRAFYIRYVYIDRVDPEVSRSTDPISYLSRGLGAWTISRDLLRAIFIDGDYRRRRSGLTDWEQGTVLHNLAYAEFRIGRSEIAIPIMRRARDILFKGLNRHVASKRSDSS